MGDFRKYEKLWTFSEDQCQVFAPFHPHTGAWKVSVMSAAFKAEGTQAL